MSPRFRTDERFVLLNLSRKYSDDLGPDALYETARKWWRMSPNRSPEYAAAVHDRTIKAVYEIDGWIQPDPTELAADPNRKGRWGFTGRRSETMEALHLGSDVSHLFRKGAQNPVRYVNC